MVKRKANKGKKYFTKSIPIDDDIPLRFNEYDIHDEIDNFHESVDKMLLSKSEVSKRKHCNEEVINVYDVDESSDDDIEYEEKINDYQNKLKSIKSTNDDDLFDGYEKNLKSWGKKTRNYYGGENEMQIDSDVDETEKDAAQLEEEESMFLQKQRLQQLDDQDFDLNIFKKPSINIEAVDKLAQSSGIVNLCKSEKIKLVKRISPELKGIFKELKNQLKYISKSLMPLINIYPCLKHLQNKLRLYLNYCVNLSFYLVLKSNHEDVQTHPILTSIKDYYMAIQQLNEIEEKYDPETYLDVLQNFQESIESDTDFLKKIKQKSCNKNTSNNDLIESDLDNEEANEISAENDVQSDDRRAIDYTISKNKGLTPRRKKENRNPRVKHRNKYKKALIRRKGQVRPVRSELRKYDGEISGIKVGIIRSRK